MKITILAAIWAKNLWDELILKNEIQYLKTVYGNDTEFFVASYDIKNPFIVSKNITYFEYFPCDAKKIKNIFRNIKNFFQFIKIIKNTDLVVIWWGGIIFDNEQKHVKNPFSQWIMRVKIAKFYKKKILFHAVWLTLSHSWNLKYLKKIFSSKNQEVSVRDNYSKKLLDSINIQSNIIPDPVFSDKKNNKEIFSQNYFIKKLHPKQFHTEDLDSYDLQNKTIWISFRKWYFHQDAQTISEIIEYLQEKNVKIILIPTSFHPTDFSSNDYIFLKYFSEKYKIDICKNMWESYKIFKSNSLDYCFAMRLHSMILSQVYSIPFFAFSYSTKTDELIKILTEKTKKWNFFLTNKNYLKLANKLKDQ